MRAETQEGDVYFNYLCGSKLASITKSGEGISYTYDGSLLTSETASGSLNQAVSYSYNNDFEEFKGRPCFYAFCVGSLRTMVNS